MRGRVIMDGVGASYGDSGSSAGARTLPASIWRAPLVPVALAFTAGIVTDRFLVVPLAAGLTAAVAGLAAWCIARGGLHPGLPLAYLGLAVAALGAAYHHAHLHLYPDNEIGGLATLEPQLVRLRGVIEEEPIISYRVHGDPLQSFTSPDPTLAVLRAERAALGDEWQAVSGRVRLIIGNRLDGLHAGDEVEVVGWLEAPAGPANPGGADFAAQLGDQRIRALLRVRQTPDAVVRLAERWPRSAAGWLGVMRGKAQRLLGEALPEHAGLAMALLLGDGSPMTRADWEKYMRTGVIHVLAISGQHLVVLALFLWWVLRLVGIRRRQGALFVALLLLGYALLAGGRAPVLRAAVMVCVACSAILLRRRILLANAFALAWLVVLAVNPTDLFTPGCQLSFLATAVLYWGASRLHREPEALDRLVEQSRPPWQRLHLGLWRGIRLAYLVNLVSWLAVTPLVAGHYNLVSPVALLLGPPVALLVSLALVVGFLFFPAVAGSWPLALVLARLISWCLAGCDGIVSAADHLSSARWYVSNVPLWWLVGFYLALLGGLTLRSLQVRWRWLAPVGAGWLCVGLVGGPARATSGEFRCTFLSVGHGCCTVLETPDGRTLLYDAGALSGPDVTRRHVAPFLWHRGIRRIDELFVSHGDLDHFNGSVALLERFAVGQVTVTPSFADKASPGVEAFLAALERERIPLRVVAAGDYLSAGDVTMDVLHPPSRGPEGNENARSMVLLVQHAGHRILLTGDLEGAGLERVLGLPPVAVDVLMAPHHGSRVANTPELAAWARARLVNSSQGRRTNTEMLRATYAQAGSQFLDTARHGAVTIRSGPAGLTAETHRTGQCIELVAAPLR